MTYRETHEPGWMPPDVEGQTEPELGAPGSAPGDRAGTTTSPPGRGGSGGGSESGQSGAKEAVQSAATTVQESARDVASEAAAEARAVASEASDQARRLYATTKDELTGQAQAKTEQAAQGLRRLSDQMGALADGRAQDAGPLQGYARDVQDSLVRFAGRLEDGGPQGLLDDVTRFARRRPLVFIGACAGAGFLLTRFVRAGTKQDQQDQQARRRPMMATTSSSATTRPNEMLTEPARPALEGDGFTTGTAAR
jgi:hypothetical protein